MRSADGERSYWRCLEGRGNGASGGLRRPEFPPEADRPPEGVDRRTMMTLMGASVALAGLSGCRRPVEKIVPYASPPENVVPGLPRRYATTLTVATDAYGVVVESHEGRPTKVEGNELHPSSGGAANGWMQASILDLYDPDRARLVGRRAVRSDGTSSEWGSSWPELVEFWQAHRDELAETGGRGFVVLSPAAASPTLARLRRELLAQYPEARWVAWEPVNDGPIFAGTRWATGRDLRPVYHLERATTILALDSDFLLTESDGLARARAFADGRRRMAEGSSSATRLYAVESALSVSGAQADHRVRLRSSQVASFALALAAELGAVEPPAVDPSQALPEEARRRLRPIAQDLARAGRAAAVVVGRRQPPEVHALALAIHERLGALGETVSLRPLADVLCDPLEAIEAVAEDLAAGTVSTLVSLGGNPAYNWPKSLGLAAALPGVEHSFHVSPGVDETARLCAWHLPEAHAFESWGDARSADGTLSTVQPLIAPLWGARSAIEVVGLVLHGEERSGYDLVRETWRETWPEGVLAERWGRALHDGVVDEASEPVVPAIRAEGIAEAAAAAARGVSEGLEITFHPSPCVYDGRFANNAWLQELADPITKITWGNAAAVSPATADELGLASGDLVSLAVGEEVIETPVHVQPGQADGSVALTLGYGRRAAGRVGEAVGVDVYPLLPPEPGAFALGATLRPTGGRASLVQTQEHWAMEGRDLVRESTLGGLEADQPKGAAHGDGAAPQLWAGANYDESPQWGMAIDLNSCIGCNACVVACQSENNIPVVGPEQVARGREMHWLRVDRYYAGEASDPDVVFQPVPCMHCENAPCEQVCPVAATVHDAEGLNVMVYNRCIGTRYCSNNCPYKVRRFNFFNYTKDTPETLKMAANPDVTVRSRGVMEKCTYCLQRLTEGKRRAKLAGRPLRDGEVVTACQQTCPADAIRFGDTLDPASEVARAKADHRSYVMLAELNNRPRTSYLAKLRNPDPSWDNA